MERLQCVEEKAKKKYSISIGELKNTPHSIEEKLEKIPCPFEKKTEKDTLGDWLLPVPFSIGLLPLPLSQALKKIYPPCSFEENLKRCLIP